MKFKIVDIRRPCFKFMGRLYRCPRYFALFEIGRVRRFM